MSRVCVIGAGSSGIASCQVLHARGIPFDCYEAGSAVGGNWRYGNDNGLSSAYRSLHAKSSRQGMQYRALPMPDTYPTYLSHELIAQYLDDFVDKFGFRRRIQFRTEVVSARPARAGGWDVTVRRRGSEEERSGRYSAVLVANGHHWDARHPEPAVPGAATFRGQVMHSRHYRSPEPFEGKRVLVVGIGNSGGDIATEISLVAARTLLSIRRGAHIVPKYLFGTPTDHLTLMRFGPVTPLWLQRSVASLLVRIAQGDVSRYGLPRPDHRLLDIPPTVSDSLLSRLAHGDIAVKPGLAGFGADRVLFADGGAERVDVVIYCTGYKISFPFLDAAVAGVDENHVRLYHRVVSPNLPGLYFIGLVQPIGAIMPIAEAQSHWVADLIEGRALLPPQFEMNREIARYRAAAARRHGPSARDSIQVDFQPYLRQIRAERLAGAKRRARAPRRPAAWVWLARRSRMAAWPHSLGCVRQETSNVVSIWERSQRCMAKAVSGHAGPVRHRRIIA
jgi:dimethylaniline monooxygenase (N-oxide forming)